MSLRRNKFACKTIGFTGGFILSDNRPIGVFDSGLGGLTAVRALVGLLPQEDIVYLGDTGRVPYGTRSKETIIKYTRQDIAFLMTFDIKFLVIACGTASTAALPALRDDCAFPVVGVVEPAARAAAAATRNGRIGLIATEAAIRSGAYDAVLRALRPEAEIIAHACPLLVPLVENGRGWRGDKVAELVVAEYMAPLKRAGVDTLILGCTHYPLLGDVIFNEMGPSVTLVDSGREAARETARLLAASGLASAAGMPGRRRYFISDSVEGFTQKAALFLSEELGGDVEKVDIENYV